VSALLPQPGGLEGLRAIHESEERPPDGLAITKRPHAPCMAADLNVVGRLRATANPDKCEHLVACVDQLFWFEAEASLLEDLMPHAVIFGLRLVAPQNPGACGLLREVPNEIGRTQIPELRVSAVMHGVEIPDELRVLLRHRPAQYLRGADMSDLAPCQRFCSGFLGVGLDQRTRNAATGSTGSTSRPSTERFNGQKWAESR